MLTIISKIFDRVSRRPMLLATTFLGISLILSGLDLAHPRKRLPSEIPSTVELWKSGAGFKEFAKAKQPKEFPIIINDSIEVLRTFWLNDNVLIAVAKANAGVNDDGKKLHLNVLLLDAEGRTVVKSIPVPLKDNTSYVIGHDFDLDRNAQSICFRDRLARTQYSLRPGIGEQNFHEMSTDEIRESNCFFNALISVKKTSGSFPNRTRGVLLNGMGYLEFPFLTNDEGKIPLVHIKADGTQVPLKISTHNVSDLQSTVYSWSDYGESYIINDDSYGRSNRELKANHHHVYSWKPNSSAGEIHDYDVRSNTNQAYFLTKAGLLGAGEDVYYENDRILYPTYVYGYGVFLFGNKTQKQILVGFPMGVSVSPNGCRVALGLASELVKTENYPYIHGGKIHLTTLNLCK